MYLQSLCAVCRWRVETGRIRGITVADYTEFYLHGREERTLANYRVACRLVGLHTDTLGMIIRAGFEDGEEGG